MGLRERGSLAMYCRIGFCRERLDLSKVMDGEIGAETVDVGGTFSHINARGDAHMVDVTEKSMTCREARATATVLMRPRTLQMIMQGEHAKGDVLAVARVAGIQGAKQCSALIPLCHPLALTSVTLDFVPVDDAPLASLSVTAVVKVKAETGVEMEALTAVSVAALTIYDMCKAVEPQMQITDIRVLGKRGGKADWGEC